MSTNWRKTEPDYRVPGCYKKARVYRPNSMRQVSVELELNRLKNQIEVVRKAFIDYTRTEGCGCCKYEPGHSEASDRIAKALAFKRYSDDSGWDWEWNFDGK